MLDKLRLNELTAPRAASARIVGNTVIEAARSTNDEMLAALQADRADLTAELGVVVYIRDWEFLGPGKLRVNWCVID